ncbi:hypothetical protein COOONC_02252 [Cooperia oncophora]
MNVVARHRVSHMLIFLTRFVLIFGLSQLASSVQDATHPPPALDDLEGNGFSGMRVSNYSSAAGPREDHEVFGE